jgi:hypothetical protein
MSPSSRSAEHVRRLQAQAARRERNRRLAMAGAAIGLVVVIVAALVIAKLAGGGSGNDNATPPLHGAPQVVAKVASVPASVLDSVGAGAGVTLPKHFSGVPPLVSGGKPEVLYMGGEFCPYCAATRWGVAVALSRFGTFSGLGLTSSASNDIFPDTATLTFHGASYSSSYVTFHGYELSDRNHQVLDTPPSADQAVFQKYDAAPYTSTAGTIPFVDLGGRYFLFGSAFDPQILQGLTHLQIADDLAKPSSPVARAVDGEANLMTAAVCQTTGQQPSSVCSSSGVKAAAARLASGG